MSPAQKLRVVVDHYYHLARHERLHVARRLNGRLKLRPTPRCVPTDNDRYLDPHLHNRTEATSMRGTAVAASGGPTEASPTTRSNGMKKGWPNGPSLRRVSGLAAVNSSTRPSVLVSRPRKALTTSWPLPSSETLPGPAVSDWGVRRRRRYRISTIWVGWPPGLPLNSSFQTRCHVRRSGLRRCGPGEASASRRSPNTATGDVAHDHQ